METKRIKLSQIKPNPNNPRIIKDDKFEKLVQSLKDFPEMADIRPVVVNKDMMILGGNMRYKAMKEAGWKDCPVIVADLTEEQQKEFIVKDNAAFGEWDWCELTAQFEKDFLDKCGVENMNNIMAKQFERDIDIDHEKIKYPITFFATKDEYDKWQDIKDRMGVDDDDKAFFEFLKQNIL